MNWKYAAFWELLEALMSSSILPYFRFNRLNDSAPFKIRKGSESTLNSGIEIAWDLQLLPGFWSEISCMIFQFFTISISTFCNIRII